MKHAYIIVTNSISEVFLTSIKMLDHPLNDIYVLFDKKARLSEKAKDLIETLRFSNIFMCEQIVNWGGYSQIEAVMNLLKQVTESGTQYEYIHFFQGADLPIKTQEDIHQFFGKHKGKEFVSIEYDRKEMAMNKCRYIHLFCHNRFFRKNKLVKALNFGFVALQRAFRINVNKDIEFYQGSALFSITQQFAEYLVDQHKEIKRIFRFSLAADECFIQTMLLRSHFCGNVYINHEGKTSNSRLIDRTRPDGKNSPHIWRDNEFETIIQQPVDICFSRKFDAVRAPQIVKAIYEKYGNGVEDGQ